MKKTNELIEEALSNTGAEDEMAEAIFDTLEKEDRCTIGEAVNLILANVSNKEARVRMAVLVSIQILRAQDAEMSLLKMVKDMVRKEKGLEEPEITILPSNKSIEGWIGEVEEDEIASHIKDSILSNDTPETSAQIVERLEDNLSEAEILYLIIVLFKHSNIE